MLSLAPPICPTGFPSTPTVRHGLCFVVCAVWDPHPPCSQGWRSPREAEVLGASWVTPVVITL